MGPVLLMSRQQHFKCKHQGSLDQALDQANHDQESRGEQPWASILCLVSVNGIQLAFLSCRLLGGQVQNGTRRSETELSTVSRLQEPSSIKLGTKEQLQNGILENPLFPVTGPGLDLHHEQPRSWTSPGGTVSRHQAAGSTRQTL